MPVAMEPEQAQLCLFSLGRCRNRYRMSAASDFLPCRPCRRLPLSILEAQCHPHPQPAPAPSAGFPCPGRHRYGLARPALPRRVSRRRLRAAELHLFSVAGGARLPRRLPRRVHGAGHGRAGRQQPEPPAPLAMGRGVLPGQRHLGHAFRRHARVPRADRPALRPADHRPVAADRRRRLVPGDVHDRPPALRPAALPARRLLHRPGHRRHALHRDGGDALGGHPVLPAIAVRPFGTDRHRRRLHRPRRGPLPARPAQRALPLHETDRQPAAGRRHRRHAFHRDGRAGAQRTRRHAAGTASQRRLAAPGLAHRSARQRHRRLRHLGRMVGETTGAPAQRKQPGQRPAQPARPRPRLAAPDGSLRQPDRPAEPHGIQRSVRPAPGELSPERQGPGGDVPRPRSLQADQRFPRPRLWRRTAEDRLRTHPQRVAR